MKNGNPSLLVTIALSPFVLIGCRGAGSQSRASTTSQSAAQAERDPFQQRIKNLRQGTAPETVQASIAELNAAGMPAFPALLPHLNDQRPADLALKGDVAGDQPPTLGEVCFSILQSQIEGNWPKDYRQLYVLTPGHIRQWLQSRHGMSLDQLRAAANAEALQNARVKLAADPASSYLRDAVRFIQRPFGER